jgi:hypothetical protein
LVLVLLLIFLVPIALYCLVLAVINRSARPLLLSGVADLLGLLFALSGFLFVVGPHILRGMFEQAMDRVPLDLDSSVFDKALAALGQWWVFLWSAYYVLILIGIGLLSWARASKTVIYNIDLATFEREFRQALDRLGLVGRRSEYGRTYVLSDAAAVQAGDPATEPRLMRAPAPGKRHAELRFEYFPALCHLTLHWQSGRGEVRETVEAELAQSFRQLRLRDNPASWWLFGVGGGCIGVIFVILVLLILLKMLG